MCTGKFDTEYWQDTESEVVFVPSSTLPDKVTISAAKIYVLHEGKLLLTKVKRGWDIPGGHLETGESPEETVVRELWEETRSTARSIDMIGYLKVTNKVTNELNKKYPRRSCIIIFRGRDVSLSDPKGLEDFEAVDRHLFDYSELRDVHHQWTSMKKQILEYAYKFR